MFFTKYYSNYFLTNSLISNQLRIELRLIVHYKGNLESSVTFLIISDFDCQMCREHNVLFEELYSKYNDKVRFGFTHYSSYVSNSAIASECAGNQLQFWAMHDSIFNSTYIPDSIALFRIAKNL